jgi:hypothetical protein
VIARNLSDVATYLIVTIALFIASDVSMVTSLTACTEEEEHAVIRFLWTEGVSVAEIHRRLSRVRWKCFYAAYRARMDIRGGVKKFPEWWYSTLMVGHTATLT